MQAWSLVDGSWREGEAKGAALCWFDVGRSDDPALDELAGRFGLHPLAIEDCRSNLLHAAKIDDFGPYLFIVLHTVVEGPDGPVPEELDAFLGDDFLITYGDRPHGATEAVRLALSTAMAIRSGPDGLLYEVADRAVDEILPHVNVLSEKLEALQDEVLESQSPGRHQAILAVRARAGRLRRLLGTQLLAFQRLSRGEFNQVSSGNTIYFRDIYDHQVRIDLALEGVREDAEVALGTYLSALNNRMNEVMKVLSVVGALALPAVVIAGIFGTNFDNVPGLHSNWGFVIMIASMGGLATGMALYFRRQGWF